MCGIAGIVSSTKKVTARLLHGMNLAQKHRGPDSDGIFLDEDRNLGLAHVRLAILGLGEQGAQPMHRLDRFSIVFNGEIYNYLEIRKWLQSKGYEFVSETDTEVLLSLYELEGSACLSRLDGMFAFAIYDKVKAELFLARDVHGEKPLYYTYTKGEQFAFASEMKALFSVGLASAEVNSEMLFNFLSRGFVQNPSARNATFFSNVYSLEPGSYLKITLRDIRLNAFRFWDWSVKPCTDSFPKAQERIDELLQESVRLRMRADVSVGSSLSGGLDSSGIVSLLSKHLGKGTFHTFSARFQGFAKDEGAFMDMVRRHCGAIPHDAWVSEEYFWNQIDKVFYHQEEPFGDAGMVAEFAVMELAKSQQVTVLLDGQGADELFAGYKGYFESYFLDLYLHDRALYKRELAEYEQLYGERFSKGIKFYLLAFLPSVLPSLAKWRSTFAIPLKEQFSSPFYQQHKSNGYDKAFELKRGLNAALDFSLKKIEPLLRSADRNSMAHSREVRLPYLAKELVAYARSLPAQYKIQHARTKYVLRKALESYLPSEIIWRKDKVGYEPPQKAWLSSKLAQERIHLSRQILVKQGVLSDSVLSWKVRAEAAGERIGNEWYHFVAGLLYLFCDKMREEGIRFANHQA